MKPTVHIEASSADLIAKTVLMPGDPLRAKFIAEKYLTDVIQFNAVRGMLGFTGYYQGKKVSVMGSGMGIPSAIIYYQELYEAYGVENIIRIGTAGSLQSYIGFSDVILATAASHDSNLNKGEFGRFIYCPTPDFGLLMSAYQQAEKMGIKAYAGMVVCGDQFYDDENAQLAIKKFVDYGAIAADMESAGLYTIANKFNKKALAIFTISDTDSLVEKASSQMREQGFTQMMELALEIAPA